MIEKRELDILPYRQLVDQIEALEDEADVAFARLGELGFVQGSDFLTVEKIGAAGRAIEHSDDVQKRRFSASGRTHDCDEFAIGNIEIDIVEGRRFDGVGSIRFGETGHGEHVLVLSIAGTEAEVGLVG